MVFEVKSRWDLIRNVLRIFYTIPFVMASVTGVVFALSLKQEWIIALLIPLVVLLLAIFVNLSNDYFDHKSGADATRFNNFDPQYEKELQEIFNDKYYWMGNTFDKGEISERQGLMILAVIAALAILLAIPILLYGGWVVLLMGGVAFFLSYFYTAPPLNLGAKGFGELDVFLSFSFMSFFSYYVIVPQFRWEMLLIAVTVGIAVMLMRVVDQLSGYEAHKLAGEKDFSVRFGREGAAKIILGCLVVLYAIVALLTLLFSWTYVLLFITLPLGLRLRRMFHNEQDRFRWIRPTPEMLKLAVGHEILLVVAIALDAIIASGINL